MGCRSSNDTVRVRAATKLLLGEGLLLNGTVRFTRAWAGLEGSKQDAPVGPRAEASAGRPAENAAAR